MSLRDHVLTLSTRSETAALALFDRWAEGGLSDEQFVALASAAVARANARAYALADVALAAQLTVMLRAPVAPLGLLPPPRDVARVARGLRTVTSEATIVPSSPADFMPRLRAEREEYNALRRQVRAERRASPEAKRVRRLAGNEPKRAAAKARGAGIRSSRRTSGWTRGVSGKGCELCHSLAGAVLPKTAQMYRHTGCSCTQIPVTK